MARNLFLLLQSVLFSAALIGSMVAPTSLAQTAPPLAAVRAAYTDMLELFYRPLDSRDLLTAGWVALGDDAARHGASSPGALPALPSDTDAAFDTFATAFGVYVAGLPPTFSSAMAAAAIERGMAESVHEHHTAYLSPPRMQQFLASVTGQQQAIGLGIRLGSETPGLIADVAPGGPAETAGLQPGDVVLAVDGRAISNDDALNHALDGPAGATVTLSVDRGSGPQTIGATVGPYYFPPLESRMLPDGVGYVRLSSFVIPGTLLPNNLDVLADLDRRLDALDAQGAHGLILDLRNNGGGSIATADELVGRFVAETTRTVHESDERGHQSYDIASGLLRPRQLPMAVLINGGSASASEITAVTLRDAHRAILVGSRTAGAVASSELMPLPDGAGLQVAVAAATAADSSGELDGVGIAPDVSDFHTRTVADYRTGHDPQIDAADAALASAPAPPVVTPRPPTLSPTELDAQLAGLLPASSDVPTNERLTATDEWQRLDFVHPNQLIDQNGGAPDPLALQQTMRDRGYEGSVLATYGGTIGDLPALSVDIDLYATADGAHAAVSTNDLPLLQDSIEPPVQVGDETIAYRGAWLDTGSSAIAWRRGRTVFTVTYSDVPGSERLDTLTATANLVDARAQHHHSTVMRRTGLGSS